MKMFEFRTKEDTANEIKNMYEICEEWKYFRRMLNVCIKQFNIREIVECDKCKNEENIMKKMHCRKCKGTGYVAILEEDKKVM